METLHFSISINVSPAVVWTVMFAPDTYKLWTEKFMEGSYFEGSWAKGDSIRFLGPTGSGMLAEIADNRPHRFISIRHLGFINNGVEDLDSEEVKRWAPAYENYTFTEVDGGTDLDIDIDVLPEYREMMTNSWPKALAKLKEVCEAPGGQASA